MGVTPVKRSQAILEMEHMAMALQQMTGEIVKLSKAMRALEEDMIRVRREHLRRTDPAARR